jgi:hypothetical protein
MARLQPQQVVERLQKQSEQYEKSDFKKITNFKLENDKDTARVRFLFKLPQDADFFSVHTLQMTSSKGTNYPMDVSCIADGKTECPFCRESAKNTKEVKFPLIGKRRDSVYMPLIDIYKFKEDEKGNLLLENGMPIREVSPEYKVWKRSATFYKNSLAPYGSRYSPMYNKITEIERNGVKNDIKVSFGMFPCDNDYKGEPYTKEVDIEKLKEQFEVKPEDIYGTNDSLVKEWTADQMERFIETKEDQTGVDSDTHEEATPTENKREEQEVEEATPRTRVKRGTYGY